MPTRLVVLISFARLGTNIKHRVAAKNFFSQIVACEYISSNSRRGTVLHNRKRLLLFAPLLSIGRRPLFPHQGPMRRRSISSRTLKPVFYLTLAFGVLCNSRITPCDAAIIASLSESRAISGEKFESDLVMSGTSDAIGDTIEFIELDVILSTVKSETLSDFTKVRFDASPRFAPCRAINNSAALRDLSLGFR